MPKLLPSPELLRKLLKCDPDNGELYWRTRTPDMFTPSSQHGREHACKIWNSKYAGTKASARRKVDGRSIVSILNKRYLSSRVIWKMHYGLDPAGVVDHISGDPTDDRIKNLRDVSRCENHKNSKMFSSNTSGAMGVSWNKDRKKWHAYISANGKRMNIGFFLEKKDAIKARKSAERCYGFHKNHGRQKTSAR